MQRVVPPQRGDIYWLQLDGDGGNKSVAPHPWVVVSDDLFNWSRVSTVIVLGLSSQLAKASEPGNVLLDPSEGDLPRQSVVVVSQIASVEKTALGAKQGTLSATRIEQILDGLRFLKRSYFDR